MNPVLNDAVWFRSRTGNYTLAADVIATKDKLFAKGVEAGHVPDLDSDMHVHLLVKTPGKPGTRQPDTDKSINNPNLGGSYVEHNVEFWDPSPTGNAHIFPHWADEDQPAGTWTWPRRNEYRNA